LFNFFTKKVRASCLDKSKKIPFSFIYVTEFKVQTKQIKKMKALKHITNTLLLLSFISTTVFSQSHLPVGNLEDGKCYAQVAKSEEYKLVEKKVLVQSAYKKVITQAAEYDTVTVGVMAHAETKEILVDLYDFEIVDERLVEFSSDVALINVDAEFEIRDNIKESIARNWNLANLGMCDSPSSDCDLLDWIELPAKYIGSKNHEGKSQEKSQLSTSVAKLSIRLKDYNNKVIPVEYRFYTKEILVKPARKEFLDVPAQYTTVIGKQSINNEVKMEWVEILCPSKVDGFLIGQIQLALKGRKLYYGHINGFWNEYLQTALENYQIKKELPVGKLDKITLEALGLNYNMLSNDMDEIASAR
jgi:hypothetical protein